MKMPLGMEVGLSPGDFDRWNSLPQDVIDADSLNTFKNGLDRVRSIKMGFFID